MNAVAPADNDGVDELYKRIFVEIKSFEPAVMDSYQKFVTMVAKELDIKTPIVHLPDKKYTLERRTLLRSVHIHKKHRRQYEIRTHYKTFEFSHLTGSTADTLLEYIQRNLPEGVAMKVTKHKIERLPTRFQKDNNKAIQESTSC
ncbi:small ribosomal subunit protein uS10m-like [Tubulanus polymorphus]|uniref:small ribosomal subunit protein uS10m-like n=1 Tax=Tubulanus polymorphus TaxID=672921 RepID=UPI003DA52154